MPEATLLSQVFEAFPAPTFLVDGDVRVHMANRAARALLGPGEDLVRGLLKRGGELLHCVHATDHPDGCGRGAHCGDCVLRGSVEAAFATGGVVRRRTRVELHRDGRVLPLTVLVSASPIEVTRIRLCVLTVEDISELTQLRG